MKKLIRNFKKGPFYGLVGKDLIWIRMQKVGWGISIKKTEKLFSERNGYVKSLPIGFGWRITILKAAS